MKRSHSQRISGPALAALAIPVAVACTQVNAEIVADTQLEYGALAGATGALQVNLGAGHSNLQLNSAALSLAASGSALSSIDAVQHQDQASGGTTVVASARIEDGAAAGTSGLLAINQASGRYNAQTNAVAIALGIKGMALADINLHQSQADATPPSDLTASTTKRKTATIGETAFLNSRGVVQVNQAAGSGNTSTNSFAFSLPAGAIR